ncbi:2-hydroxychromene-2-carboxylate isomerase [Pseudohalioglobus lutimaris]|uniref:2-hydroxychromene-2-carboxylate isomerase n=1 Tax=Pseudohalioglobus lutimaris TaxID=1737061 RepID=A0A2N5X5D5_9GAMM|nr:2-hydroxychromene-2-carboxylate isomerase [Pseudohalioglobus lutimaris]PLW69694.1 2-hydroxychromene-2-carboxylate isomerase [Pseudohalioglobus lutimaris]
MVTVDFIFDFGSPNAYYSYKVLPEILQRTGAEMVIHPVLLGGIFKITGNQPPMLAFGGVKGKLEYEMLESKRFVEKHKLNDFRFNTHFPVNTVSIMRGLLAAQELGCDTQYTDVVLSAMWEQSLKMDDPEVMAGALKDGGIDAAAIMALIQTDAIKEKLKANTQAAADRGVFGIPTFFVGEEMFFGKDRLGLVEEEILKQQRL